MLLPISVVDICHILYGMSTQFCLQLKFLVLLNIKLLNLKEECCYCVNIHNESYHNPVFIKLSSMDEPLK
jgi:hypothetical protein